MAQTFEERYTMIKIKQLSVTYMNILRRSTQILSQHQTVDQLKPELYKFIKNNVVSVGMHVDRDVYSGKIQTYTCNCNLHQQSRKMGRIWISLLK